ncbi:MAG: hypothetical protein A2504_17210 [Bdellovibrionales bacterium RIFOXYD12_FULL_39_22]|nr:MAG: hypothetical protein A2385_10750 [Bdellovibrionales bacterium RIFOXYB1_FULL_39_21]OFZ40745.1 MAG: hypothetical protein A2485_16980 [Bdellovibrionales bacterium RIFOXYC12_FULL_39_17]OFZ48167.1 MAG: hypothetical protein A2404_17140 [Bdellovibrionales bacterium RIFOXYC1_FULL_39_130]OFZ75817.1 MAG: hypothetical protein A2560_13640 [Bdellovibrionales bacterium RIFOXYD1_FULL_39_84]OFZ76132.1 MAG: hypothetical protein A2451_11885 [Bdellovibrionales bacterium RIFOXYC2_FULL_39_8]OFZ91878.1 MAG:
MPHKFFLYSAVLLSLLLGPLSFAVCPLKNGDLIFIKSQSSQAKLLRLVTNSEWTHVGIVYKNDGRWQAIEAISPVKWSSLHSFIARSTMLSFEVRRPNFTFNAEAVKEYAEQKLGEDYDLIFAWDDDRWYCSELVYKTYLAATQQALGTLERIEELAVNDPSVLKEIKRRYAEYGLPFAEDIWRKSEVITPINMMNSKKLIKISNERKTIGLMDCLLSDSGE